MLVSLSILALAALANALQITTPTDWVSESRVTVEWTNEEADQNNFTTFTIQLVNPIFNNQYAIANNLDPSMSMHELLLPNVPADANYYLAAVNIGNINQVYARSGTFAIAENPDKDGEDDEDDAPGQGSGNGNGNGNAGGNNGTTNGTPSGGAGSISVVPSTTRPSVISSSTGAAAGSASSRAASASAAASSAAADSSSNGALKFGSGAYGAALLAAVAGAAVVAL